MSQLNVILCVAALIIVSMGAYAATLFCSLHKQKKQRQHMLHGQANYSMESIQIIAQAMLRDECDLSEGVIRINGLLNYLSSPTIQDYSSLSKLYNIVKDMPILEARNSLKKNEKMHLDLIRESAEVELEQVVKEDLRQLLNDLENGKYYGKNRMGFSAHTKI